MSKREDELAAQVARGIARCKATLAALKSTSTNLDDLPVEAARVMAELEDSHASLKHLHEQAIRFARDAFSLRHENSVLWDFFAALAGTASPEQRAEAAREALRALNGRTLKGNPAPGG